MIEAGRVTLWSKQKAIFLTRLSILCEEEWFLPYFRFLELFRPGFSVIENQAGLFQAIPPFETQGKQILSNLVATSFTSSYIRHKFQQHIYYICGKSF